MLPVLPLSLILALHRSPAPPTELGDSAAVTRFSVDVRGRAGQTVRLRAVDVPTGYLASFCTRRVCAPFRVTFVLPRSGRESIELQLIENDPGARRPMLVRVAADGARSASIVFAAALSYVPAPAISSVALSLPTFTDE